MKWGLLALGVVALASIGWGACTEYRVSKAEATRDSALAVSALLNTRDSLLALDAARSAAKGDSLEAVANRHGRRADSLTAILRRPQPPLPLPDMTASDSARYWRATAEGLQVRLWAAGEALTAREAEVDDIRAALDSQKVATAKFKGAYEGERDRANGLEVALRKMPTGCRKLLGIPMPRFGPGVAVTRRGVEPALAGVIPLGGC